LINLFHARRSVRLTATRSTSLGVRLAGLSVLVSLTAFAAGPAIARDPSTPALSSTVSASTAAAASMPAPPASGIGASAATPASDAQASNNAAMFRNRVPPALLEQQAAEQYSYLINAASKEKRLLTDKQKPVQRVRLITNKLIPYALKWNEHSRQWHWEINVINTGQINAICLPGGKLLITTGMLDRLHLSDSELAMLLGHEIAHALREHARDRTEQDASPLAARKVPRLFGLASFGSKPLSGGTALLALSYTRDDETEADVIGTEIAARAGYDPRAAISLWYKLDGVNRLAKQAFVQAHPFDQKRIVDLQKHMRDMLALYAKALSKPISQLPHFQGVGYAASARRVEREDNTD